MKKLLKYILHVSLVLWTAISFAQNFKSNNASFNSLIDQFQQPDKAYGSAPLWVWNADVSEGKIDTMLREFKKNAFGGVFVHPRPGLITPYLSDKWFSLYKYTVAKGKELGLDVWIYDENSYPSGFAGGHVPEEMPSSYNQGQMLNLEKAQAVPTDDTTLFLVLKKTASGFESLDFRGNTKLGNGDYYLFRKDYYRKSPWYGGYSYVDLLAKGVTEKFIDVTMRGYEKNFGNEFGHTVPGVFTDEPNIEVQGENNIRWTPDLFETFQKRWGYNLQENLPCLFEEVGNWKKVRHNYYQVLLQLFIDRWSKPWQAYTDKKKLEWTGHYWEHGWPNPNHGGDNMAMYAWHQRPAIDMLFNQFNEESPNAQFGNIRSVKELASVANQLGKQRTLSETYGGGGWELTFQDMKRLGDWQYVLGVNTLNQHLSYMTMVGARKYDYPQSFSYHNPWWPYYDTLNEYFARLSLALSTGKQQNDILIIEPTTSAWMYSTYQQASPRRQEIGQVFQSYITKLEKAQVEYDLGSENIIKDHGSVEGKKFIVGERAYSKVVLPPGIENLDQKTAELLLKFVLNGGALITEEDVQYIDGVEAKGKLRAINEKKARDTNSRVFWEHVFSTDKIQFHPHNKLGDLYHQRRSLTDGELLFLANSSVESYASGTINVHEKYVYLLDLNKGEVYNYPTRDSSDLHKIDYNIPPAGSLLLFYTNTKKQVSKTFTAEEENKYVSIGTTNTTQVKFLEPNVLTLDFCDVHIGDTLLKDQQVFHASDTIFKHFGFKDGNPWNTSVQYKDNIIKRDTFSNGEGFKVDYHFNLQKGVDTRNLQLVVERPWLWEIYVNEKVVQPAGDSWYLDKDFKRVDIAEWVKEGGNKISIVAKKMRVHAEVEPIYILGNFNLKSADKGWSITPSTTAKIGSWKTMGKPLYGQSASYSKIFTAQKGKKYKIQLGRWAGTAALLKVNGKLVDNISYPPYTTFLEGIKEGENTLEVIVIGSLKNTLGPHHNKPKPGMVSPWLWRGVKNFPKGLDYDVYDYGLFEDFSIQKVVE